MSTYSYAVDPASQLLSFPGLVSVATGNVVDAFTPAVNRLDWPYFLDISHGPVALTPLVTLLNTTTATAVVVDITYQNAPDDGGAPGVWVDIPYQYNPPNGVLTTALNFSGEDESFFADIPLQMRYIDQWFRAKYSLTLTGGGTTDLSLLWVGERLRGEEA